MAHYYNMTSILYLLFVFIINEVQVIVGSAKKVTIICWYIYHYTKVFGT